MVCFECGSDGRMHQHHVVPRSRGGTKTVPLCELCHGKAHGRRMRVSELTRDAMQHMRAQGRRVGSVPHGYADDGAGRLVAVEAEQRAITLAGALAARGHSLRAISYRLAMAGHMNRRGRPYNPKSVARLVAQGER